MDNEVVNTEVSGTQVEDVKRITIERPVSLVSARMLDESWEDYVARRIQIKKWSKQSKFFKSSGDDNRAARRKATGGHKLRFTKPLRKVRDKWVVGETNVTRAIKTGVPLHQYLRVAAMGLDIKKLTELGNEFTEEQNNGNLSNKDT